MKPYVEVQFSGNPKLYGYLIPEGQEAPCGPGVRVVVISKMKDDKTPGLSIATIVNVGECSEQAAIDYGYKPFVQYINPAHLTLAVAAYSTAAAAS